MKKSRNSSVLLSSLHLPQHVIRKQPDARGSKEKKALKRSQEHPSAFGRAVCRLFDLCDDVPDRMPLADFSVDAWDDAKLGKVQDYLAQTMRQSENLSQACPIMS